MTAAADHGRDEGRRGDAMPEIPDLHLRRCGRCGAQAWMTRADTETVSVGRWLERRTGECLTCGTAIPFVVATGSTMPTDKDATMADEFAVRVLRRPRRGR